MTLRLSQARQAGQGVVDFIGTFDYLAGEFLVFHFLARITRISLIFCYCLLNPGTRIQKTHNPPHGGKGTASILC